MNFPPPTERQAQIIWVALTAFMLGLLIVVLGAFIWGLGWVLNVLSPVLWPLAIGGVLAYLLDPLVDFLERRKVPRPRAIIVVFGAGVLLVGGLLASIIPRLVYETGDLIHDVPAYSKHVQERVTEWLRRSPFENILFKQPSASTNDSLVAPTNGLTVTDTNQLANPTNPAPSAVSQKAIQPAWARKVSESAMAWLSATLPKIGAWFLTKLSRVGSFAGVLIGLVMVPVFTYYFLQEKKAITQGWTHYLPLTESRLKEEAVFVINSINNYLIVFFRGQVVVAMINAVLLTIGFLIMGLDYAVLIGVIAGILGIVPYLGTVLTIIPAIALAAVQFKDWLHPVLVIAIFGLVNFLEGFVISPKVMGDRVGLHPLTIIIAVLVGTTLMGGILGGILAIPLTAALRVLMFRYIWKRRQKAEALAAAAAGAGAASSGTV